MDVTAGQMKRLRPRASYHSFFIIFQGFAQRKAGWRASMRCMQHACSIAMHTHTPPGPTLYALWPGRRGRVRPSTERIADPIIPPQSYRGNGPRDRHPQPDPAATEENATSAS
ncbi:hypothetical protein GOP47_0007883 [Adiantum capillus-veneris]|uniref:Uncharacterized protein n=1 Tax=Adiantum capillus-veneris TaxID=13818 RepID=A0A9D4V1N7_ADICA|nr:hypothetical protein GOP47_0007883 [Adiantum capillus-veneris]